MCWKEKIQWQCYPRASERACVTFSPSHFGQGKIIILYPTVPASRIKSRRTAEESRTRSYVKLSLAVGAILVEGPNRRHIFGREPSNDYFIKI